MMLAQRFRQTLHRVCQSFTGLSLYEHLSTSLSHPQLPATQPHRRPKARTRHLRLGTFNVQSIGSQRKLHETLPRDLKKYKLDILGLQETRITYQSEQKTGTYHLLTLPTSNRWHGIGFAVAPNLRRFLHTYWAQSDRVGVLQLRLPHAQRINIINAYSPHSGYPPKEVDQFYADLSAAQAKLPSRDTTFIVGDFNAKVGRRRDHETFIGDWGRGRRNRNGHLLSSFCESNHLFLANTAFRKRARNITTWTHRLPDRSIFNQIDYILCHQDDKALCANAQSWGGALTQSDHKLVTLDFDIRGLPGLRRRRARQPPTAETRLATQKLVYDDVQRRHYRELLKALIDDERPHHHKTTNQRWTSTLNKALEAAEDTVGYLPRVQHVRTADPELARLSQEQRQLRLMIYNDHTQDVRTLRRQRNIILHKIRDRSKAIASARIDEKLTAIEESSPSVRLFEATRALFRKRSPLTSLLDSQGKYVLSRRHTGNMIKRHFQDQFVDPTRQPVPADGLKQPLKNPVTADELERAFKRLRNGRAVGPDAIPAELLKYGATALAKPLADIINDGFSTGDNIHLGDGILLGLPKPNKPAGQCTSLRPIVLLNSIRKAISLVVLQRISPKVESFLSPHQSGFRPSRSTADAVWAHRWIAARALRYKERFHILGIDLSRAFDTVNRDKLLSVLEGIVDNDELRLIRLLLRETNLSLRLDKTLLSPFESNTGTPQGDSLSPVLFVVYLEAALRDLAAHLDVPHNLLADMIVYADDADFICRHPDIAKLIETQAPAILATWSLQMNTSKTEHTEVLRSPTACSSRIARKTHESWRNTRKLGSLLGDTEDLSRRKNLASAAFHRMWKIWLRPSKTSEETRLRLYNCYVLPILLYNCGTWALQQADLVSLESFHRKQLRQLIGVRFPDWISNDKLYERTGTEPLRYVLLRSRWRLFGHILRRPTDIPANRFMEAYFQPNDQGKWRGRRRLTLPLVLDADLQTLSSGHRLQRAPDLYLLRVCAHDRKGWKKLTDELLIHAPTAGLWPREERNSRE